jgi:signal transduction histidine kinase
MSVEPCQRLTPNELRRFDLFKDDDEAALLWLSERFEIVCYEAGDVIVNVGDAVDRLGIILEGEIYFTRPDNPTLGVFIVGPGEASGRLPFSRMKTFAGTGIASKDTRMAALDASHLRELVCRVPFLAEKLVWHMTDRTREFTQMAERNSKMLALGKLSAGLAHELNNPASAVVRSATRLREMLLERRQNAMALRSQFFPQVIQNTLEELSKISVAAAENATALGDLERSDKEAELADWLDSRGIDSSHAADLITAGIMAETIDRLSKQFDSHTLDKVLNLLLADHQMLTLISEVEEAARRMSQLVQDVKSYSYMDTSAASEVDVEEGIRATLRMFQHQLKHGFTIKKEFAPALPRIHANGNELNQVWTNLIDNAIDAMEDLDEERRILEIRTADEHRCILVQIVDHGEGIPKEVQGRIFEPFFTTKSVGKGTGLGLDIVQRIVRNHKGSVHLDSKPGRTVFQIRLPKI